MASNPKHQDSGIGSASSVRRPTKRRFPGPAGLLPILPPKAIINLGQPQDPLSQKISKLISSSENVPAASADSYISYSQDSSSSSSWFESQTWIQLLDKLQSLSPNEQDFQNLMSLMNIKWIRSKVTKRANCTQIPFLVVVLPEAPEIINARAGRLKAPKVKLIDPTGSIEAVIDCKFVLTYSSELVPGCCLALRNVAILRLQRKFLLTITENNLVYMTSCIEEMIESQNSKSCPKKTNSTYVTIPTDSFEEPEVRLRTFTDFDLCVDALIQDYHKINQVNRFEVDDEDDDEEEDERSNRARGRDPMNQSNLFSTARAGGAYRSPVVVPTGAAYRSPVPNPTLASLAPVQPQKETTITENSGFENEFDDEDDATFLNVLDCIDILNEPDVF